MKDNVKKAKEDQEVLEVQSHFFSQIKVSQQLWALQDKATEDWVVLDSVNFEDTDAMPLWSSEELAKKQCSGEWQAFQVTAITVADWLEFWLEDLKEDGVMIGLNWQEDALCAEMELADFSQSLAEIETL